MAIQPTDRLIVSVGQSYWVEFQDIYDKIDDFDKLLVQRDGVNYYLLGSGFKDQNFLDSDLFIVERNGVNYKCFGSELKRFTIPTITSANWDFTGKNGNGSNFRLSIYTDGPMEFPAGTYVDLKVGIGPFWDEAYITGTPSSVGGATYWMDTWTSSPSAKAQISPSFDYSSVLAYETKITLFIPITIQKDGNYISSGPTFNGDTFEGNCQIVFPGLGTTNSFVYTPFSTSGSMWN